MRSFCSCPPTARGRSAKAMASGADALILDLEDCGALDRKAEARAMTRRFHRLGQGAGEAAAPLRSHQCARHRSVEADLDGVMSARAGRHHAAEAALGRGRAPPVAGARSRRGKSRIRSRAPPASSPSRPRCRSAFCRWRASSGRARRLEGLTWGAEDLSAEVGSTANREPTAA